MSLTILYKQYHGTIFNFLFLAYTLFISFLLGDLGEDPVKDGHPILFLAFFASLADIWATPYKVNTIAYQYKAKHGAFPKVGCLSGIGGILIVLFRAIFDILIWISVLTFFIGFPNGWIALILALIILTKQGYFLWLINQPRPTKEDTAFALVADFINLNYVTFFGLIIITMFTGEELKIKFVYGAIRAFELFKDWVDLNNDLQKGLFIFSMTAIGLWIILRTWWV